MNNNHKNLKWDINMYSKVEAIEAFKILEEANPECLMRINNALSELMNSIHEFNESIAYSDRELEGKIFRFVLANGSFIKLLDKSDIHFKNKCHPVLDVFTLNTVLRMQIESFLMIYYLSFYNGTQEERNMRYDLYKLNSLKKQLTFKPTHNATKKKHVEVKREYDELRENLKINTAFIERDIKTQEDLLKFKYARLVKPEILFKESGIDKNPFENIKALFSNHTHSEYLSDRQYNSIYKEGSLNNLNVDLNLKAHVHLTAKLCMYLLEKFKSPQKVFSRLSKDAVVFIHILGYAIPNE